jgi:hypothetical protein
MPVAFDNVLVALFNPSIENVLLRLTAPLVLQQSIPFRHHDPIPTVPAADLV